MWIFSEPLMISVAVAVQVAGLLSMAIARVCECSARRVRYQTFFFVSLLLVGFFCALMASSRHNCRLICALTLPVMAVGATLDMGKTSPSAAF